MLLAVLGCTAGLAALATLWGLLFGFPGSRPQNLGVHDGRLAPCPRRPNCVSSFVTRGAPAIAPLPLVGEPAAAMARVREIVEGMPRTTVVAADGLYLRAEQATRRFGFVDDFELLADPEARVIHVRSAARLGWGDHGGNRARVERLRRALGGA
jgi:uncharacterized protein (DUF1499 family)